jgi:hypothetical protein
MSGVFTTIVHADAVRVPPLDKLRRKYPTKFDELITFQEEGHLYFYAGKQLTCRSVSSLAKRFHPEEQKMDLDFMAHQTSKMMYRKTTQWFTEIWTNTHGEFTLYEKGEFQPTDTTRNNFFEARLLVHLAQIEPFEQRIIENRRATLEEALDDIEDFYKLINAQQIRTNWNWSAQLGTDIHEYIEAKLNGVKLPIPFIPVVGNREYDMVDRFFHENKFHAWRTELRVYSHKYDVVGSVDFVHVTRWNEDGTPRAVGIGDWKRTHKIKESMFRDIDYKPGSNKRYLPPLAHLQPTTRNDYTLQLSTYAYIIESELGLEIDCLWLGVVHASNDCMFRTPLDYLRSEAIAMMETQ